jgi:hypothetical protein
MRLSPNFPSNRITVTVPGVVYAILINGGSIEASLRDPVYFDEALMQIMQPGTRFDQVEFIDNPSILIRGHLRAATVCDTDVFVVQGTLKCAKTKTGQIELLSCSKVETTQYGNVCIGTGPVLRFE